MKELYNKTNKYLSITSTCLTTQEAVYISHETFPNIPVWKAILMSCAIPLIFKPIEWENKLYIDGGLVDNFPLFNINLDNCEEKMKYLKYFGAGTLMTYFSICILFWKYI